MFSLMLQNSLSEQEELMREGAIGGLASRLGPHHPGRTM